jgi:hypothetical protein
MPYLFCQLFSNFSTYHQHGYCTALQVARRTIVISGLPKLSDLVDLQEIEYSFFDLFVDFNPENIHIVPMKGMGYVKLADAKMVNIYSLLLSFVNFNTLLFCLYL